MTLMDKLLQPEEKRTQDILKEVEDSIAMGNRPKARQLLRRFVEFEKALGKTVVKGGATVLKTLAEERRQKQAEMMGEPMEQPEMVVSPTAQRQDPKILIDNIVNRLERLKGVV